MLRFFLKTLGLLGLVTSIDILASNPKTLAFAGILRPHPELSEPTIPTLQQKSAINNPLSTLRGTVVRKLAAKNSETWMAGGSEYYVLDVGNFPIEIEQRSALEGVILRPSETVESFAEYVGKSVEVRGYYVEAQPYVPQSPMESYPVDRNGNPLPTGAGFKVEAIAVLP